MTPSTQPPPHPPWRRHLPVVLGMLVGIAVEIAITQLCRKHREAWDNPEYFTMGLPAMYLASGILGWLFPRPKSHWRLGMAPFAGELLVLGVRNPSAGLLPLGIILLGIFSLPGTGLAKWMTRLRGSPAA